MTERHAAQAPALRERYPQIFNRQFPDMNKTIAVTISGELRFDLDSIRKAADTLNQV